MKKIMLTLAVIVGFTITAQNVGVGTTSPDASAKLDVSSTARGFLPPRLTNAQRDAIASPATGLMIYNTDEPCLQVNNGTPATPNWNCFYSSADTVDSDGDGVIDLYDPNPTDPCTPAQTAGYAGYDTTNTTWADADCDGDGETNGTEATNGSDPYNPASTSTSDQDGDGVADISDADPTDPCTPSQAAGYTGYDSTNSTWADADCDGDGETNGTEVTNGSDPYDANSTSANDTDGDGIADINDTAPADPCTPTQAAGYTGYNSANSTWADADCDGDGETNGTEASQGSDPYDANSNSTTDTDGDGVADINDAAPTDPCTPTQAAGYTGYDTTNTTWAAADCDGDGETNGTEATNGSDPYNADSTSTSDQDGDGLLDVNDSAPLDPCVPVQVAGYTGYDASNATWQAADCDGDGETNGTEVNGNSDPYNADSMTTTDDDGDGLTNINDTDAADPCSPAQVAGYTGYDSTNATWAAADCDGDGDTNGDEAACGADPYDSNDTCVPHVTSATGRIWMDRNLGASQVATSPNDENSYGDYYQHSRATDGHEKSTSSVYTSLATTTEPNTGEAWDGKFITTGTHLNWYDDINQPELWGLGTNSTNNPCPAGYYVPSAAEWQAETATWSSVSDSGGYASVLKLPYNGGRKYSDGTFSGVGSSTQLWASDVGGTIGDGYSVTHYGSTTNSAHGFGVRCIKE